MPVEQASVAKLAELDFAFGKVGQRYPLSTPQAEKEHAELLSVYTLPLTHANTAGCGDDRPSIELADGTFDPLILRERVVSQLFGGLGLATTKALVAADAEIVKDTKNMWEAYEIVSPLLYTKFGEEDAGHAVCSASGSVEKSVAHEIPHESLMKAMGVFVPHTDDYDYEAYVQRNTNTKRARLEYGFYGGWDPAKHQDYLITRFPKIFRSSLMTPMTTRSVDIKVPVFMLLQVKTAALLQMPFTKILVSRLFRSLKLKCISWLTN